MPAVDANRPLYEPLDEAREAKITKLLHRLKTEISPVPPVLQRAALYSSPDLPTIDNMERVVCYSVLIVRKWDVDAAFKLAVNMFRYRDARKLDQRSLLPSDLSIRGYDMDDVIARVGLVPRVVPGEIEKALAAVTRYIPCGYHYWDRQGLPVFYAACGRVNISLALKKFKQITPVGKNYKDYLTELATDGIEIGFKLCQYQNEVLKHGSLPNVKKPAGLLRSGTIVADMTGLTYKSMTRTNLEIAQHFLRCMFLNFPDCLQTVMIVNCPPSVSFGYNLIKGALSDILKKKALFFTPEETPAALDALIGAQHVPSFCGGKCNCPGGCIPWLDDGIFSSADCGQDEGEEGVVTENIKLKAGEKHRKNFDLEAGETVVWEFSSTKGIDVRFSIYFVPKTGDADADMKKRKKRVKVSHMIKGKAGEAALVKTEKISDVSSEFSAPCDGTLILQWDNSSSWVQDKPIQMRVFKAPAVEEIEE